MASGGRSPSRWEPLPGDQFKLASGRTVVLTRRLGEDSWLAQYVEDAQRKEGSYDHLVVREAELRSAS
jgi:hypothetical protein